MNFEYSDRRKRIIRYVCCILIGIFGAVGLFCAFEYRETILKKFGFSKVPLKTIEKFECKECKEEKNINKIIDDIEKKCATSDKAREAGEFQKGDNHSEQFATNQSGKDNFIKSNEEYSKLVDRLAKSVVHIKLISLKDTDINERYSLLNALGGEVFPNKKVKVFGSCSGFFVSEDGYITTNHHCIDDVQDIEVETKDGRTYKGKVVGYFEGADLAVIKIEPKKGEKFSAVKIGNSDSLSIGDNVLIIGGPLGYKWSASSGIVSGKARDSVYGQEDDKLRVWGTSGELIQIDAAVNPGNSGGPAFNMNGEVVGVASAGYVSLQGMNFIVASNTLKEFLPKLMKGKIVQKGLWGLGVRELEPFDLKAIGMEKNSGMLIDRVVKFGPAEKAGIKRGDVITKVDGVELKDKIAMKQINSKVFDGSLNTLEINRYGKMMRFQIKAVAVKEIEKLEKGEIGIQEWSDKNISYRLLTSLRHDNFNFPKEVEGIIVTEIKSYNDPMLTLAIGDVIMGVDDKQVKSIEDYQKILSSLRKKKKTMAIFHIYKPTTKQIIVKGSKIE